MVTNYAGKNGVISEKLIRYHEARAKGGVGLNILEATSVHDSGRSYFPGVSIASDAMIKGLASLTSAIHKAGGKAGIQLHHAGRLAKPDASGQAVPLVSFVPGLTPYENSRVLDTEDIWLLIEAFTNAATRAVKAGFDVVEVHGAHGYLIAQFMSPLFNHREDEFGGSYENRLRFPLEVVRRVRAIIGSDTVLSFRISADEILPGGINPELAACIAIDMAKAGVDLVNVSAGLAETNEYTGPPPALPKGWNAINAELIRKNLDGKALVAVAGRITDRKTADKIISSGQADMVVMGRALIADPDLPKKLAADLDLEIRPCIGCNEGCVGRSAKRMPIECAVNPRMGKEGLLLRQVGGQIGNEPSKRIVVVGAGPAGMEAALTAAKRGHKVTLYERSGEPGGLLNVASLPPHKDELRKLKEYYEHALAKAGVDMKMNKQVGVEEMRKLAPDAIFVCAGSEPVCPGFAQNAPVIMAEDVLQKGIQNSKILVLGGGLVGCETAEGLAMQGNDVTILELRSELAPDMHVRARRFLLKSLKEHDVKLIMETRVKTITPDGIVSVEDAYGNIYALPHFDAIILALGYHPHNNLCKELAAAHLPFTPLGDCLHTGKIMDAIHSAHETAASI